MKFIVIMFLVLVFGVGFVLGNVDHFEFSSKSSGGPILATSSTTRSFDIPEFKAQLRDLKAANAELTKQYQELKVQLAENVTVVQQSDRSIVAPPGDDFQGIAMSHAQHSESHASYVEIEEQTFYSSPVDFSTTSNAYEALKVSLLSSEILQYASVQNLECRGGSCLIEIHEPSQQMSDDERFTRQFELSVLLRESGFKSSVRVENGAGTLTLISQYN